MPFYSGVKEGGAGHHQLDQPLLSDEDIQRLKDLNGRIILYRRH